MNKTIIVLTFLLLASCGQKETKQGCTEQNTSSSEILISCKTLRKEAVSSTTCTRTNIENQQQSQNEICQMGFDINCAPARIVPSAIKTNVDNGTIILKNKNNNKKLKLTQVSGEAGDLFLILQHQDDAGLTSTVDLPVCSN